MCPDSFLCLSLSDTLMEEFIIPPNNIVNDIQITCHFNGFLYLNSGSLGRCKGCPIVKA